MRFLCFFDTINMIIFYIKENGKLNTINAKIIKNFKTQKIIRVDYLVVMQLTVIIMGPGFHPMNIALVSMIIG